jgi:hypothetical protein
VSYYGRPVLKQPVWKDYIGWYLFSGGLAGASSVLAAGARLTGRAHLARVARRVGMGGLLASPALLIADLGRPDRFANMLRVARPTSPMSMGSWLLSVYGPVAGAATVCDTLGVLPGVAAAADATAGVLGSVVTSYTGVLLADTAVPVWHGAGRDLPLLFATSAASSAGAAAALLARPEESGPARRLALAGLGAERAAMGRMERRLGPQAAPYRQGRAGRYARAARWLGRAGAVALLAAGATGRGKAPDRRLSSAGPGLLLASAAATRFAVFRAGFQSAAEGISG